MILKNSCRCLILSLLFVCVVGANDLHAFNLEKGKFLIATEQLNDPRFRGGVILLIQHDARGTVGLIINRPSRLPLASVLPKGSILARQGEILSYGGPVEPQTLLTLVKIRNNPPEPAEKITDTLYATGVVVLNEWSDFAEEVVDYRVFVGYTGWAAGQLEVEMQRGGWSIMPGDGESIFAGDGVQLWEQLRARTAH